MCPSTEGVKKQQQQKILNTRLTHAHTYTYITYTQNTRKVKNEYTKHIRNEEHLNINPMTCSSR